MGSHHRPSQPTSEVSKRKRNSLIQNKEDTLQENNQLEAHLIHKTNNSMNNKSANND